MQKDEILRQFKVDQKALTLLCEQLNVNALYVFGSVLRSDFMDGQSDIDFLVEFSSIGFDQYFDLLEGLKSLFAYDNIDLVSLNALKNQVIRASINNSKQVLYAA